MTAISGGDMLDIDEQFFVDYFFHKLEGEEVTLLDVGSAAGRFSQGFKEEATLRNVEVMVHSFDPRINGLAVGEVEQDWVPFIVLNPEEHSQVAPLVLAHTEEMVDHFIKTRMITVDSYLNLTDPSVFLKIDTEGYELPVLRGARKSLASGQILAVQFEYGGTWEEHSTLIEAVDLLDGYVLWQYDGSGLAPLTSYEDDYERSCNYLAMRAA